MPFERGCFYRRLTDGVVYRCEQAKDVRALLHSASMAALPSHQRRLVEKGGPSEIWQLIPKEEEGPFIETYSSDAVTEYGTGVAEKAVVYRRQYHFDPYMAMVGTPEMRERLDIIADNSVRYDARGKVSLEGDDIEFWHRKTEEVIEELSTNPGGDLFATRSDDPRVRVLRLTHDIRQKSDYSKNAPWNRVPALPSLSGPALFRFDRYARLVDAMECGKLRISPGSAYSDPSLGPAQRDVDEQRLVLRPSPASFPIVVTDPRGGTLVDSSAPRNHQIAVEIGGDQDFYVWCCSEAYEPRLFIDFKADACLVVQDANEFMRRVNAGLLTHISPLPGVRGSRVRYYDPLCIDDDVIREMITTPLAIMFFKDWKYTYQAEYRFVWPVAQRTALRPIDIEVAPLRDICTLLRVKESPFVE